MKVTPEMLEAMHTLRTSERGYFKEEWQRAFDVLDNADVFAEIDDAAYAAEELEERSPNGLDPAEYGDMAFGPRG